MPNLYLRLTPGQAERLSTLALEHHRSPREQAEYLLTRALRNTRPAARESDASAAPTREAGAAPKALSAVGGARC